jgi:hypothetical protein
MSIDGFCAFQWAGNGACGKRGAVVDRLARRLREFDGWLIADGCEG